MVIFAQHRANSYWRRTERSNRTVAAEETAVGTSEAPASLAGPLRLLPCLAFYFAEGDRFQFHSGDLVRIDDLDAPNLLFKD